MISTGGYNSNFDAVLGVPVQELIVDKDLIDTKVCVNQCLITKYHFRASYCSTYISDYNAYLDKKEALNTFSREFK